MKPRLFAGIASAVLIAVGIVFVLKAQRPAAPSGAPAEGERAAASPPPAAASEPEPSKSEGEPPDRVRGDANSADPEFQRFIRDEAKAVDSTHIDSAKKARELAEVVAKLTPGQVRQLLQTALNPSAKASERILSAYLMVEAGGRAESELRELIVAPLGFSGAQPAHSENETRAMQERSVRVMALEGLLSRAEREGRARETLAKTIPDIPDPYIKDYAQKRLDKLKPH